LSELKAFDGSSCIVRRCGDEVNVYRKTIYSLINDCKTNGDRAEFRSGYVTCDCPSINSLALQAKAETKFMSLAKHVFWDTSSPRESNSEFMRKLVFQRIIVPGTHAGRLSNCSSKWRNCFGDKSSGKTSQVCANILLTSRKMNLNKLISGQHSTAIESHYVLLLSTTL